MQGEGDKQRGRKGADERRKEEKDRDWTRAIHPPRRLLRYWSRSARAPILCMHAPSCIHTTYEIRCWPRNKYHIIVNLLVRWIEMYDKDKVRLIFNVASFFRACASFWRRIQQMCTCVVWREVLASTGLKKWVRLKSVY